MRLAILMVTTLLVPGLAFAQPSFPDPGDLPGNMPTSLPQSGRIEDAAIANVARAPMLQAFEGTRGQALGPGVSKVNWFRLEIGARSQVELELRVSDMSALHLRLFTETGNELNNTLNQGGPVRGVRQSLEEGTYAVGVVNRGLGRGGAFGLIARIEPKDPDGADPSDSRANPQALTLDEPVKEYVSWAWADQNDWYSVELDEPGDLAIELAAAAPARLSAQLVVENGSTVALEVGPTVTRVPAGRHLVHVWSAERTAGSHYTVAARLEAPKVVPSSCDEGQPRATVASSGPWTAGGPLHATFGPRQACHALTVSAEGELRLQVAAQPGADGIPTLELLGAGGAVLGQGDAEGRLSLAAQPGGYTVRIGWTGTSGSYRLWRASCGPADEPTRLLTSLSAESLKVGLGSDTLEVGMRGELVKEVRGRWVGQGAALEVVRTGYDRSQLQFVGERVPNAGGGWAVRFDDPSCSWPAE